MRRHIEHFIPGHGFRFIGRLRIVIRDAVTGRVLQDYINGNKIVDAGLNLARDLLGGGNYSPSHIAVGTGATAPAAGDTVLDAEVFRNKVTLIDFDPGAIVQFQLFLGSGEANGFTLAEAGLFNSQITDMGDLFSRVLITPTIDKDATITVTLQWSITVARA